MGLLNFLFSSCSHQENKSSKELDQYPSSERKMEDVIKNYFDKQDWHYRVHTEEDSIISFQLGFNGENEKVLLRVDVLPNNAIYQIISHSETKLPKDKINDGIIAINNYNIKANIVSGCIGTEGNIIFWLGRNIDGNTFSEQAFATDFDMVIQTADYETAQIYKQALINNL